jgi:two-component system, chemotaxis family, protein-glutamate methylesterase/glutaminase
MPGEIIVVGASRGGLRALETLLSGLDAEFDMPIVIVQHRGKDIDTELCSYLRAKSPLPVTEPEDKEPILTGRVYLAPRDYHLMVAATSFALSTEPPINFARPSIDVLFQSAAEEYRERAIGLILTGTNRDGANGIAAIRAMGGMTIVEDPDTAAHREMPEAALAQGEPNWILQLEEIAPKLRTLSTSRVYVN